MNAAEAKAKAELQAIYDEHSAVNDVMLAFQVVRRLRCTSCGAKAQTTEPQGMRAAREMYDQGWTATRGHYPGPTEATCPDCGIL